MKHQTNFFIFTFFAIISSIALTGCGDIVQNLKINPDGSGTLETSFDVGELMSMTKGLQGSTPDNSNMTDDTMPDIKPDTVSTKTDSIKDPMQLLIAKVTDPAYDRDFDTLMPFLSIMPDSIKAKETRLDLADKLAIRLKSPAKSPNLIIGLVAKFDSPAQLKDILHYMEKLDEKPEMMAQAGPVGLQNKSFLIFDMDKKAGWIKIDSIKYGDVATQFGMSQDSSSTSEDQGMMQLMFGNSKLKSIIQVPGEVISCTNPDAIITKDNRVLLEYDFLDVVRKGSMAGFTIQFKPQK